MKKIIIGILVIGMLAGVCHFEHNYTRKECVVTQINDGCVTFVDKCGWTWDTEDEGFEIGQIVDLKMHDSFTSACIDDDVIKKVIK